MSELKNTHTSTSTKELDEQNNRWFFQNYLKILATGKETNGNYFIAELSHRSSLVRPLQKMSHLYTPISMKKKLSMSLKSFSEKILKGDWNV